MGRVRIRSLDAEPVAELDAIVCCSDLQGVVAGDLLGVALAAQLVELAEAGVLPPTMRTGVVLAGDLYSVPAANKRGGFGDVTSVWEAFATSFAWVVGVAGNHDDVTGVLDLADHVHCLDGDVVEVDGIRIGGVGRAIGDERKPGRRGEDEQRARIAAVIDRGCDVLVLHDGPPGDADQFGNPAIEVGDVPMTVCGHRHWKAPLATSARGQVLNVDARAVVLIASRGEA